MNIFAVDSDPIIAARCLVDKHVVKMILETAQILCSAFPAGYAPYRRTHYNHPCSKWVRDSARNFNWLIAHGIALNEEYVYRFNAKKDHASHKVILWCRDNIDKLEFSNDKSSEFPLAMPEDVKESNPVQSYRNYYKKYKRSLAKWTNRNPPEWWE